MLLNMLGFNIAWIGLITQGNYFIPIAALMLFLHFKYCATCQWEVKLVALITLIGISVDSILHFVNVFIFESYLMIPAWLILLWICFATTICHSLAFLSSHRTWQVLLGLFIVPLSYRSGEILGAVQFGGAYITTHLILGVIWGGLLPLCFSLKQYFIHREVSNV